MPTIGWGGCEEKDDERRAADHRDDYQIETDWGIIEHPTPDQPGHFVVGHLLLIDSRMVAELLTIGVPLTIPEGIAGAYLADSGVVLLLGGSQ